MAHERLKLNGEYLINIAEYNPRCELTYLVSRPIKVPRRESQSSFLHEIRATPDQEKGAVRNNSRWGLNTMDIVETPSRNSDALIELTADVVAAYVSNNPVP